MPSLHHGLLKFDHGVMQFDHGILQFDHGVMKIDYDVMELDHGLMKFDHDVVQFDRDVMKFDRGVMQFDHGLLKFDHDVMKFDYGVMKFDYDVMKFDQGLSKRRPNHRNCLCQRGLRSSRAVDTRQLQASFMYGLRAGTNLPLGLRRPRSPIRKIILRVFRGGERIEVSDFVFGFFEFVRIFDGIGRLSMGRRAE